MFNVQNDLPFVRTTESVLKDALLFLLAYDSEIVTPDNGEFEVSFNFAKEDNSYIRLEIDTSLSLKHSDMNTLESVFEYPISGAAMGKLMIKALDGEFIASLHENRISYKILLPRWSLLDDVEKAVRVNIEKGSVELFLGQKLEVIKSVEQKDSFPLPKWEIIDIDPNIIAHSATGGGTAGFHMLKFTTIGVGNTVLKFGYAPSYSDELSFYTLQVTVKAQPSTVD
jgi:hypothetical protein